MKKLTLLGTGLAGLLMVSATSLAIQCKLVFDSSGHSHKVVCKPAGVATFAGGAKIPLYDVIISGGGIIGSIGQVKDHHPYINFYVPKDLAKDLMVLYDGGFELVPRGYTYLYITNGADSFGVGYVNKSGDGCVGQGGTGGVVESACNTATWFHDPKDIRKCGMPLKDLQPDKSEIVLRKNYRHKVVLVKELNSDLFFFCTGIKGLKYHPGFMVQQGGREADVSLPENQKRLAWLLANYYYHMYTH